MVFIQAVANDESPAARILDLVDSGEVKLYMSEEILSEARNVLSRPELRGRLSGITDVRVEALFRRLERKAFWMRQVPRLFEYPRDPKDEPYINLAVAAGADYIISCDKDLLALMTGYNEESKEFRQRFRPLKVITPPALLEEIERGREEERQRGPELKP